MRRDIMFLKLFQTKQGMREHVLRHDGSRDVVCVICGKKFNQKVHLRTHMMVHSGTKPFKCPFCENASIEQSKMRLHIKNIHEEGAMDKFKCNNCQKPFKHRVAPSHKIVCKTVDYSNGQVSCRLCGEKLTSVTLKDHWRVHPRQIKSLKCRFCEKLKKRNKFSET